MLSFYRVYFVKNYISLGVKMKKNQVGDKNKKNTLSSSFRSTILGIVIIVLVSFLISTYVITEKERKAYAIRESESVLKALSNNIRSDINYYGKKTCDLP